MLNWNSPGEYDHVANIPKGTVRTKLLYANTWQLTCKLDRSASAPSLSHPDELLELVAGMLEDAAANLRGHLARDEPRKRPRVSGQETI